MTRIDRSQGAGGPEKPRGPQSTQGPDKVGKTDFIKSVGSVGPVAPTAGSDAALAARMHARIRDGLARNLSKDQILHEVVGAELDEAFGKAATPKMRESVSAAFEDEPRLRSLFNDLFDRASRGA